MLKSYLGKNKNDKYSSHSLFDSRVFNENRCLVHLYDKLIFKKELNNCISYKNGNKNVLLLNLINYAIEMENDYNQWNNNDKIFAVAYLLSKFKYIDKDYNLIFIDEYQNYSLAELSFIHNTYSNAAISFFGDEMQRVELKGESNVDALGMDIKKYTLKTNYRNCKDVCEFINSEFNMKMYPVGIDGKVEKINNTEDLKVDFENDRTALIIKDIDIKELLIKNDINIVKDSQIILRNTINVLDVSEVKGLEFEKVYVYDKNMTKNEKYLAYSRALNHLVVIK